MLAGDDVPGARVPFKKTLRDAAVARGIAERKIDKKIQSAVIIRSYALKPEYEVQDSEAQGMLNAVCAILQMVGFGSAAEAEDIVCPESNSV